MDIDEAIEFVVTHPSSSRLATAAHIIMVHYQQAEQCLQSSESVLSDVLDKLGAVVDDERRTE